MKLIKGNESKGQFAVKGVIYVGKCMCIDISIMPLRSISVLPYASAINHCIFLGLLLNIDVLRHVTCRYINCWHT